MKRKVFGQLFVLSMLAAPIVAQTLAKPSGYDGAAERAIAGTIDAVVSFQTPDDGVGVHFDLKTPDGLVSVHVGPAAYIGQQNFWFLKDDRVAVIGARMSHDGNVAVWARALQKGPAMLVLRNDDGTPKWTPPIDGTDGCGVNHAPLPRLTER